MGRVLCADYGELASEGKRLARVAACTPFKGMTPDQFADAYDFFCDYYLTRNPDTEDIAGYYPPPRLPSPPFHRKIVADLARYQKHILIYPRFSAKSVIMSETVPMWLCLTTKRFTSMIVCSSTKNCVLRMSTITRQLTNNQRIIDDMGVQKPMRGEGSWSPSIGLDMLNGSRIIAAPITSRLHGNHPDYLSLDDIEGDIEDSSMGLSDPVRIRAQIEHSIFRTLLPTLRPGKVCVWIGTSHSQQTLIYRAYADDRDPRWRSWNKSKQAIYWQNDDGTTEYLWPEMYSPEFVEKQRRELGPSAFAAEFLGEPASEQDRLLLFNDKNHQYWCIDGPHPSDESDPLESRTTIAWSEPSKRDPDHSTVEQQPAGGEYGLFPRMYRILVVDWRVRSPPAATTRA